MSEKPQKIPHNELALFKATDIEHLAPSQRIVDALRGTISEPVTTISREPGHEGEEVTVQLVTEGSGMFGLRDWRDNQKWSSDFNHSLLSARYGGHLSLLMKDKGYKTDPQRVVDASILSQAGKRIRDEAKNYPDVVRDAAEKAAKTQEALSAEVIREKVPVDVFNLIVALGHDVSEFPIDPKIFGSLDYRLASYVDHGISSSLRCETIFIISKHFGYLLPMEYSQPIEEVGHLTIF